MPEIEDGETAEVKGSAAKPYQLRNVGGVYSCSCPAWRNQSTPIERRTCKHLRKYRGEKAEEERLGGQLPTPAKKSSAKKDAPPILLAHAWDNTQDLSDWWISEKLDGVRAYWDGKRFLSRQGNEYKAPAWFVKDLPSTPLDGELWLDRNAFQKTISIVRRQDRSEHWKKVRYLVFDAPAEKTAFEDRVDLLKDLFANGFGYADLLEHSQCKNLKHLQTELKRVETLGGEGLMLREPGSVYEVGRSSSLLKVKTFHDAEATVIAHQPGKGKHKGRMGALSVMLSDGTEFSIGTGFTDKQRDSPPEVGSEVTFRYQELTDGGVPRFPSFVGIRKGQAKPRKNAAIKNKNAARKADRPSKAEESSGKRYFELNDDSSSKFWEVETTGTTVTVRYGRIGAQGTTKPKELEDEAKAIAHAAKLIKQKTSKGYVEK